MNQHSNDILGARQASPQDLQTKMALINKHFPKIDAYRFAEKLASIDESNDGRMILHFHEDDRIDVDPKSGSVRQFGVGAAAKALGQALAESTLARFFQHPDDDWGRGKSPSTPVKLAPLTRAECEAIASKWKAVGFNEVTISKRGVLVQVDTASYLRDRGDEAILEGQVSEKAIIALMVKAKRDWGGRIELIGTDDYKAQAWAVAQKYGVTVVGYEPPTEVELGGKNPGSASEPTKGNPPETTQNIIVEKNANNVDEKSDDRIQRIEMQVTIDEMSKNTITSTEKSSSSTTMNDIISASNDETYDIEPFDADSPSL